MKIWPPGQRCSQLEPSLDSAGSTSHTPAEFTPAEMRRSFRSPRGGAPSAPTNTQASDVWAWRKWSHHDGVRVGDGLREAQHHFSTLLKKNKIIFQLISLIILPAVVQDLKRCYSHHFKKINSMCGRLLVLSASRLQTRSQFFKRVFLKIHIFLKINFTSLGVSVSGTLHNPETLKPASASLCCGRGWWTWQMWAQASVKSVAQVTNRPLAWAKSILSTARWTWEWGGYSCLEN